MIDEHHELRVFLMRKPCFCCGCWCLAREDAARAKRIFRLVRAIEKAWDRDRKGRIP